MKTKFEMGTVVLEFNHSGIPDKDLKPEVFTQQQLTVLEQMEPALQKKIRRGYPVSVLDKQNGDELAAFNMQNVKPTEAEVNLLAKAILDRILEWRKEPEHQKQLEELVKAQDNKTE